MSDPVYSYKPSKYFFKPMIIKKVKTLLFFSILYWFGIFLKHDGFSYNYLDLAPFVILITWLVIYYYQIYRNRKSYVYKITDEEVLILLKNKVKQTIKINELIGYELDEFAEGLYDVTLFIYLDYDMNDPKRVTLLGLSYSDSSSIASFLKSKGLKERMF